MKKTPRSVFNYEKKIIFHIPVMITSNKTSNLLQDPKMVQEMIIPIILIPPALVFAFLCTKWTLYCIELSAKKEEPIVGGSIPLEKCYKLVECSIHKK
jgi:hypothetical protein